jgi:hypothetical protein
VFKKKNKIEVVPESEYTDFSDREESKYATKETFITAALASTTAILGYKVFASPTTQSTAIPVSSTPVNVEPVLTPVSQTTPLVMNSSSETIPTGYIADQSLETLANVLDPILDLLIAISFPIASVMVVGALFFLMFGNSERAMSSLMKTSVGYCLIQLSPLLLGILRTLGESVAPQ